ncbi:hypothetical protein ACN38_g10210, partial [Penicillium nordicum]
MYLPIELQSQILYETLEICPLQDLWKLRAVNCMVPSCSCIANTIYPRHLRAIKYATRHITLFLVITSPPSSLLPSGSIYYFYTIHFIGSIQIHFRFSLDSLQIQFRFSSDSLQIQFRF